MSLRASTLLCVLALSGAVASCDGRNEVGETGPGGNCEQDTEECQLTFQVAIVNPDRAPLPDSTYEIVLDIDGDVYSTVCGSPQPGMFECEPVEGPDTFEVDAGTFDGQIFIEVANAPGDLGRPESLHLVVTAGDAPLVDHTQALHYREPDDFEVCAVDCISADDVTVEVPRA